MEIEALETLQRSTCDEVLRKRIEEGDQENTNLFHQTKLNSDVNCSHGFICSETVPRFVCLCDSPLSKLTSIVIFSVQSALSSSRLSTFSKYQLFCITFSILLLNSDYADARTQFPRLSLKWKTEKSPSKVSLPRKNPVRETRGHFSSGTFILSLVGGRSHHVMKRQTGTRTSFLRNHRRLQRLVTKYGHLIEVKKNGKVKGTRKRNAYSMLEFISIKPGIMAIRAFKTKRYLAMDRNGNLVGLKSYISPSCNFHEELVESKYFVYFQNTRIVKKKRTYSKQVYVGFDNKGKPKRGKKVYRNDNSAHFQKFSVSFPPRRRGGSKNRRRQKRPKNIRSKNILNRKQT